MRGDKIFEKTFIFPNCKTLKIDDYDSPPDRIKFNFRNSHLHEVTILIEDREKALRKRLSTSNSLNYIGTPIKTSKLESRVHKFILSFAQTINLEQDKGSMCINYPTKTFASFYDCDERFVYQEMKHKYNLMPFWAAPTLDEVTKLKYFPNLTSPLPWKHLLEGSHESNCSNPCKSTKVKFFLCYLLKKISSGISQRLLEPYGLA